MATLVRREIREKDTSPLLAYARNNTSQGGEDGIIEYIFGVLGESGEPRMTVDIGAWDGKHLSNTYSLLHHHGWHGLLVEANSSRAKSCSELYKDNPNVIIECKLLGFEDPNSLSSLLRQHNVPQDFDLLCIDIDGADYHMWKELEGKYSPKVVIIEFNPTIPNRVFYVQERDLRVHAGSSLLALNELGASMSYSLIVTTTFNAIFLRHDLVSHFPNVKGLSLEHLHGCHMGTDVFQTYEGELVFCGSTKLLWHRKPLNPQQLQPLRKKDRKYPFAPPQDEEVRRLLSAIECFFSAVSVAVEAGGSHKEMCNIVDVLATRLSEVMSVGYLSARIDELIAVCLHHISSVTGTNDDNFDRGNHSLLHYSKVRFSDLYASRAKTLVASQWNVEACDYFRKALFVLNSPSWKPDGLLNEVSSLSTEQWHELCNKKVELARHLCVLTRNADDVLECQHWLSVCQQLISSRDGQQLQEQQLQSRHQDQEHHGETTYRNLHSLTRKVSALISDLRADAINSLKSFEAPTSPLQPTRNDEVDSAAETCMSSNDEKGDTSQRLADENARLKRVVSLCLQYQAKMETTLSVTYAILGISIISIGVSYFLRKR